MTEAQYLSRGMDYLGELGARLADLHGLRTLILELIQNADDATEAKSITFRIRPDSLIVDNDGYFTDCGSVEERECAWRDPRGHRCDFHRFRLIGAGDKRQEAETAGAFGIGFVSVYQVTDAPEVISAGRHWILREDNPESERILVCPGCSSCDRTDLPGTRFILPWAKDPDSSMRIALRADAVAVDTPRQLRAALEKHAATAMLFLRKIERVDVEGEGRDWSVTRSRSDDVVSLASSSGEPQQWHVFEADFEHAAGKLRRHHQARIEASRSARVRIAIPLGGAIPGLLFADLPTEQSAGLPFHLAADFFPSNDRKSILLGTDYRSEWNRTAIATASTLLASNVSSLPHLLGPQDLWQFIEMIRAVHTESSAGQEKNAFGSFWEELLPVLKVSPVVPVVSGGWTEPAQAHFLRAAEEADAVPLLHALGLRIVDEALRRHQNTLQEVGVTPLGIEQVCEGLEHQGLIERTVLTDLPEPLTDTSGRLILWQVLTLLHERQARNHRVWEQEVQALRRVAIAPGHDSALWPPGELYRAGLQDIELFDRLGLALPLLSLEEGFRTLLGLVRPLDLQAVLDALEAAPPDVFRRLQTTPGLLSDLMSWLESQCRDLSEQDAEIDRLRALPIFPGARGLAPLLELSLPGGFEEPLGLSDVIDLDAVMGHVDFLRSLGIRELDLRTFVLERLPGALISAEPEQRSRTIALLAEKLGELRDQGDAQIALKGARLVACVDGEFRRADECYFRSDEVAACLGHRVHIAEIPPKREQSIKEFYVWLGVASRPRINDVVATVERLAAAPPTQASVSQIAMIVGYLSEGDQAKDVRLRGLEELAWLPGRSMLDRTAGNRWFTPRELHVIFEEYLFRSQATFLALPLPVQQQAGEFLERLGVRRRPSTLQVVRHLKHLVSMGEEVNLQIYRTLNQQHNDPALKELIGSPCLWLGHGVVRAPNHVFWSDPGLGRYRAQLSPALREFAPLLTSLGVQEHPGPSDALAVLSELSGEFGAENRTLDDEATEVLNACWSLLSRALDAGQVVQDELSSLRDQKCVVNRERLLMPPSWMFFENRAGLAEKFGDYLRHNVVTRDLDTGNALAAAGVRPLGAAIETVLLEFVDPRPSTSTAERVFERRALIARVLHSQQGAGLTATALERLAKITHQVGDALSIEYRLKAFGRTLSSGPQSVPAQFSPEDLTVRHVDQGVGSPWSSIAREIAVALFPDEDPGLYAAGIKEALAASSVDAASQELDELGFPRLAVHSPTSIPRSQVIEQLGNASVADKTSGTPSEGGETQPSGTDDLTRDRLDIQTGSTSSETERQAGPGNRGTSENARQPRRRDAGAVETPHKQAKTSDRGTRSVLRSYVSPADPGPRATTGETTNEANLAVDRAGVDLVLRYEIDAGRRPVEMPHENEGYDIESYDADGNLDRYIEVKSFSGSWDMTAAGLTRSQFDLGRSAGASFWLYVVERATSADCAIYRIQNPAQRTNYFMFDDGWRSAAEGDDSP